MQRTKTETAERRTAHGEKRIEWKSTNMSLTIHGFMLISVYCACFRKS